MSGVSLFCRGLDAGEGVRPGAPGKCSDESGGLTGSGVTSQAMDMADGIAQCYSRWRRGLAAVKAKGMPHVALTMRSWYIFGKLMIYSRHYLQRQLFFFVLCCRASRSWLAVGRRRSCLAARAWITNDACLSGCIAAFTY